MSKPEDIQGQDSVVIELQAIVQDSKAQIDQLWALVADLRSRVDNIENPQTLTMPSIWVKKQQIQKCNILEDRYGIL